MTVPSLPSQESSRAAHIKRLGEFSMSSRREGDVHTINVIGEMDLASTGDVEQQLLDVEASDACVIFVDLSAVTFIDSTAIKMLVCSHARSRDNGNRLALRRPPDSVRRVLRIYGVDGLLPFADCRCCARRRRSAAGRQRWVAQRKARQIGGCCHDAG